MKLDRNITTDGTGKYALVLMRQIAKEPAFATIIEDAMVTLSECGVLDLGETDDTDFFVLRLKDKCAASALRAYAHEAAKFDPEYAAEITALADKAANHPHQKQPD